MARLEAGDLPWSRCPAGAVGGRGAAQQLTGTPAHPRGWRGTQEIAQHLDNLLYNIFFPEKQA
jgi:hypothetical protein